MTLKRLKKLISRCFYCGILASTLILLPGCASVVEPDRADNVKPAVVDPSVSNSQISGSNDYKIGVDDQVQVSVWRNADLSVEVPVRPDGKISVPLIGDIQAGGLTPRQVASNIEKRLSQYVRDPNVTIIITELRSHEFLLRVRITGGVEQPMSIPYRPGMTVLDAVLTAGGVNAFAAPNRTKVYRKTGGKIQVIKIRLGKVLYQGKLRTNIDLRPGDIVTVPERLF
jgi:polysaccharide biosynthesis/export protein